MRRSTGSPTFSYALLPLSVYMDSIEGAVEKKRIQGGARAELSEAEAEEVRQQSAYYVMMLSSLPFLP